MYQSKIGLTLVSNPLSSVCDTCSGTCGAGCLSACRSDGCTNSCSAACFKICSNGTGYSSLPEQNI